MRAIRLYEERGLIYCNRDSKNARILDVAAQERLEAIASLKRLGLTISEISGASARVEQDPQAVRRLVEARLFLLIEQQDAINAYLALHPTP